MNTAEWKSTTTLEHSVHRMQTYEMKQERIAEKNNNNNKYNNKIQNQIE